MVEVPELKISHSRIQNTTSQSWDLSPYIYKGGTNLYRAKSNHQDTLKKLPVIEHRIKWIQSIKEYFEEMLEGGFSEQTINIQTFRLKLFFSFCDKHELSLYSSDDIEVAFFNFSEHQLFREQRKEIKSGYALVLNLGNILSSITLNVQINVTNTRLKKPNRSQKAISREADKQTLSDSSRLGWFVHDICKNFIPKKLDDNILPIYVEVRKELVEEGEVNLTPHVSDGKRIMDKSLVFPFSQAKNAFNLRVSSECLFFIAMTDSNSEQAFNLEKEKFNFKPLGDKYQIRQYKNRKGGEVLFTIPKPYRAMFERYLDFINQYANESKWIFPQIDINGSAIKRKGSNWDSLRNLVKKHDLVPWVEPRSFRKTGLNLLLRVSADEGTAADYGNHAVETFRQSYELPSQQRAIVEIARFWDSNDPLTHGVPNISLFNTPCGGVPEAEAEKPKNIVEPDCLTPSGCLWCKYFRDENSLDYLWNLYSYRYLKMIESSSYLDTIEKPSNLVIEQLNKKIQWFEHSQTFNYEDWLKEAEMRIEEGCYHPNWELKISKYEG